VRKQEDSSTVLNRPVFLAKKPSLKRGPPRKGGTAGAGPASRGAGEGNLSSSNSSAPANRVLRWKKKRGERRTLCYYSERRAPNPRRQAVEVVLVSSKEEKGESWTREEGSNLSLKHNRERIRLRGAEKKNGDESSTKKKKDLFLARPGRKLCVLPVRTGLCPLPYPGRKSEVFHPVKGKGELRPRRGGGPATHKKNKKKKSRDRARKTVEVRSSVKGGG